MLKIIDLPSMTADIYTARFKETGLSCYQMQKITDVSIQRQKRVMNGEPRSLVQNLKTGEYFVPKSLVLALLCVENGFLIDQD